MTVKAGSTHELQSLIDRLHDEYKSLSDGEVATYIPELGRANPEHFGICVVTADGRVFEAGDCDQPFTIQSISKPLTFGMALEEFGYERVRRHVDVEPSGDAFNSIELQNGTNRPHNPMVNSGAITVTALLYERFGAETFDKVLARFSAAAGVSLSMDQAVYESERRTGHRNRAIAHLLLNFGLMPADAEAALDVYFRQCSILVTCRDLAVIGATLANICLYTHLTLPTNREV
jgi:glutaminase